MLIEWLIVTTSILAALYILSKMFYYKSLAEKEKTNNAIMKTTLSEAEILIRKYQIQLQRSLGNIDILTEELTKIRKELKVIKSRNSQYKLEGEKLKSKIEELENKIEALI